MWEYNAQVVRVVDGDTLDLRVDLGFTVSVKIRVRLYGINTPEIHGVKKESEEWERGDMARRKVLSWLDKDHSARVDTGDADAEWGWVRVRSHDGRRLGRGKYGRWIVEVYNASGECLNTLLVEKGLAEAKTY